MKNDFRARNHPAYWAFVVHRVSGVLLTLFLPLHFWALSQALAGEARFDTFLRWTEQPLVKAGEGAPGQALRFAGLDIGALDAALEQLARNGDPSNATRVSLARSLSLKAAQPRYEAFLERAPAFIAAKARDRCGPALEQALANWSQARGLASGAIGLSLDPQATVFQLASHVAALAQGDSVAKG